MKSSKIQKLMKDTGLVVGTPARKTEYVKQVSATDVDLVYTFCTTKRVPQHPDKVSQRPTSLNRTIASDNQRSRKSLRSHGSVSNFNHQRSFVMGGGNALGSLLSPTRATSPEILRKERFDFSCFIMFWIKIGQKCYPDLGDKSQAVLLTIEQFVLPLLNQVSKNRQIQNTRLTKLITVANTKVMIDFMSDLFTVVTGDIFLRYTADTNERMSFEAF